jgi:hypothetical protein
MQMLGFGHAPVCRQTGVHNADNAVDLDAPKAA